MNAIVGSSDPVVLSAESMQSTDDHAAITSNIDFVNALFKELLKPSEVSHDALLSYYIDYYLSEVNNGGFAQFVYNTGWKPAVISLVRAGLAAIGASKHEALFEKGEWLVAKHQSKLSKFLASAFFGENAERDRFNAITNQFYDLEKAESLEKLNAAWLTSRPNLRVVPEAELRDLIMAKASLIPDLKERLANALAAEPEYMKRIRALCKVAGHSLEQVTGGDPVHEYEGGRLLAWHFFTEKGHHLMIEVDGKALMFQHKATEPLAEITIG